MDTTYNVTRSKQLRLGIQELLGRNSRADRHVASNCSSSHRPPLPPSFGASFSVRIAVPIFQMVRAASHRYAARAGSTHSNTRRGSLIVVDPDTGQDWSRVRMITSGSTAGVDLPPGADHL